MAWAVLEELLLDAEADARGALVARTNVRAIASELGVSKDTAARALKRLARANLVTRVASPRGERGALPTSSYVIDLANVVGVAAALDTRVAPTELATSPRSRVTRPAVRVDDAQTSLFDLPAGVS